MICSISEEISSEIIEAESLSSRNDIVLGLMTLGVAQATPEVCEIILTVLPTNIVLKKG
jgi:hypothetical protein